MPVDANIALGVRPVEAPNMLAMYGDYQKAQANQLALQNARRENALAAQTQAEANKLNVMRAFGADFTDPKTQALAAQVAPNAASKYIADSIGAATSGAELQGKRLSNEKAQGELTTEKVHRAIQDIVNFNTVADIHASIQRHVAAGDITPEQGAAQMARVPKTDAEIPAWQSQTLRGLLDAKDRLATQYQTQSLGDRQRVLAIPKFGGADLGAEVVPGSEARVNATPNAVMADNTRRNLKGLGSQVGGGAPVVGGTMPVGRRPAMSSAKAATAAAQSVAANGNGSPAARLSDEALLNAAYREGRADPNIVNRSKASYAAIVRALRDDPTMNFVDAHALANTKSSSSVQTNMASFNALPGILVRLRDAGKALNFSDFGPLGEAQAFIKANTNDPKFRKYIGIRNDAVQAIARAMRQVGMSDKSIQLELESAPKGMSPRGFEAWYEGQKQVVEERQKQYKPFMIGTTRSAPPPGSSPPPAAIAELRRNPGTAKQFDEIFGAGAAARALRK